MRIFGLEIIGECVDEQDDVGVAAIDILFDFARQERIATPLRQRTFRCDA